MEGLVLLKSHLQKDTYGQFSFIIEICCPYMRPYKSNRIFIDRLAITVALVCARNAE